MQIARVVGDVVATLKDAGLHGHKLLVIQPITPERVPVGRTLVAADAVSAGVGEYVFFVRGREASFPFLPAEPPVDACVVGIVDTWDVAPAAG
ncbi:MAG: EutN/CcmL family microcompartment protein [Vicinamibacterales bacterium]